MTATEAQVEAAARAMFEDGVCNLWDEADDWERESTLSQARAALTAAASVKPVDTSPESVKNQPDSLQVAAPADREAVAEVIESHLYEEATLGGSIADALLARFHITEKEQG